MIILEAIYYLRTPSTHSSMKVKDRVCKPSPHISNLSVDVRTFLQNAAGAFSLPPVLQQQELKYKVMFNTLYNLFHTFPCSEWTVYVMETTNSTLDSKIRGVMFA